MLHSYNNAVQITTVIMCLLARAHAYTHARAHTTIYPLTPTPTTSSYPSPTHLH